MASHTDEPPAHRVDSGTNARPDTRTARTRKNEPRHVAIEHWPDPNAHLGEPENVLERQRADDDWCYEYRVHFESQLRGGRREAFWRQAARHTALRSLRDEGYRVTSVAQMQPRFKRWTSERMRDMCALGVFR